MRSILLFAAVMASMFPYTQIVPLESYVQPYAVTLSLAASVICLPSTLKYAPAWDNLAMISFAVAGMVLFFISCLPQPNGQDVKSLLMYVSPLFFYCVGFTFYRTNRLLFRNLVTCSAMIWLVVGLIQTFVNPTFASHLVGAWSEASAVVVESGRGVLSLAPEPTHHGFHMLLLAALLYLLKGRTIYVVGCILASILLARSSSAVLALLLGFIVLFAIKPIRMFPIFCTLALVFGAVLMVVLNNLDQSQIRVLQLSRAVFDNPTALLTIDNSINNRIGGLVAGLGIVWNDYFLPAGLSNNDWLRRIPAILGTYPWLFDLSLAGIPSGIVIIFYQMGFLGVVFVMYFIYRIVSAARSTWGSYMLLVVVIVFLGQLLISNPIFGLLYGCVVASLRKNTVEKRNISINTDRLTLHGSLNRI
jgi:hypothetical protein